MFYVIGLGNPGEKYKTTRHNVGRMVVEQLAGGELKKNKSANALSTKISLGGEAIELYAPETFMNRSGDTAKYLIDKRDAIPEELIVVHDDIDLPFSEIKIGQGKGSGGNNGVDSIIKSLSSKDFVRVRVGIAPRSFWTGKVKRPAGGGPLERFVLKPFSSSEAKELPAVIEKATSAIETIVANDVTSAMNKFN